MTRFDDLADAVLAGGVAGADDALDVLRASDDELLALVSAAARLRRKRAAAATAASSSSSVTRRTSRASSAVAGVPARTASARSSNRRVMRAPCARS